MHQKIAHIDAKRITDTNPITIGFVSVLLLFNCQRWDFTSLQIIIHMILDFFIGYHKHGSLTVEY